MKENSHIDKNTFYYLKPDKPKVGRFYLLPTIHKVNNPGRPIVSANGHPTEKISEFVDFHLRTHVEALPSHLKDTTDYLQKMESMNPFLRTPLFFRWTLRHYTLTSHIMTVSKHVERPGTNDWLKTGKMTFYKKWYSMDFTNYCNTHVIYTHYMHSVVVQDFVSGRVCCVNQ
jgi:hypothetical protein